MPMFEISALSPMLKTRDLAQTIAFYTQTLGFTVTNQMNDGDGKPSWVGLDWNGVGLMFYSSDSLDSPPGPPAMTGVLYFNPRDVRALWAHLKDRAPIEWELQEMPYGMLEFAIRDPNGYILSFGQEITLGTTPGRE
jgi:uncharacterized glyoxalase superfamily protein PhnB